MLLENAGADTDSVLPIYADGFPGIMYTDAPQGVFLHPGNRQLSPFLLYGQTIEPIQIAFKGTYKMVVFQLYPFASWLLLGINPKELNDDCYDLLQLPGMNTAATLVQLRAASGTADQCQLITQYIHSLIRHSSGNPDASVQLAINLIISHHGSISIKAVREQLYITERTFERRFATQVGVTPKQFAKIIQFSNSLNQLKEEDYLSLTEISYDSGFADQSHFIRTFKRYAGKTPREFQKELAE